MADGEGFSDNNIEEEDNEVSEDLFLNLEDEVNEAAKDDEHQEGDDQVAVENPSIKLNEVVAAADNEQPEGSSDEEDVVETGGFTAVKDLQNIKGDEPDTFEAVTKSSAGKWSLFVINKIKINNPLRWLFLARCRTYHIWNLFQ